MIKRNINISIDASTICQLKCPECSTTKGVIKNGIIGTGYLSFLNFKKFLIKNKQIKNVELSNWGEIFLNPELLEIIKYAFENRVKLTAGNGVNFNNVSDELIEALVKYKFGYINFSIDGASQETYVKYRVNGNYDNVINNIKRLNYYKSKYKSELPKLSWQFILFGHNEHEILKVKSLCKELNMVFNPKLNFSEYSPINNVEKVKKETGLNAVTRIDYKNKNKKHYKRPCCQLWFSPQISWDGKMLGCCVNKWKSFGNVFELGLFTVLNSQLYQKTLSILKGVEEIDDTIPCYDCPTYNQILEMPVTDDEIAEYSKYVHPAEKQINEN
jgi:MoaA/NifB/PqqE/SkfB family radical SAM enzyme